MKIKIVLLSVAFLCIVVSLVFFIDSKNTDDIKNAINNSEKSENSSADPETQLLYDIMDIISSGRMDKFCIYGSGIYTDKNKNDYVEIDVKDVSVKDDILKYLSEHVENFDSSKVKVVKGSPIVPS